MAIAGILLIVSWEGCNPLPFQFFSRIVGRSIAPTELVPNKVADPIRKDVRLSVLWIGHASTLIQIHDKVFLTDPIFTKTVGMLAKRSVEPGINPASISRVDFTLISHTHMDHFSYGTLTTIPRQGRLFVPPNALEYVPELGFAETLEMQWWKTVERDRVKITSVPVQHFSGRYGFDSPWMYNTGYNGYIIEYAGVTVFFGGDLGYNSTLYKDIGVKFKIDLALLPIAPVEPRDFMKRIHTDPAEALQVFEDVGAQWMIPIHHSTMYQGLEPRLSFAKEELDSIVTARGMGDRVFILRFGEQKVWE